MDEEDDLTHQLVREQEQAIESAIAEEESWLQGSPNRFRHSVK